MGGLSKSKLSYNQSENKSPEIQPLTMPLSQGDNFNLMTQTNPLLDSNYMKNIESLGNLKGIQDLNTFNNLNQNHLLFRLNSMSNENSTNSPYGPNTYSNSGQNSTLKDVSPHNKKSQQNLSNLMLSQESNNSNPQFPNYILPQNTFNIPQMNNFMQQNNFLNQNQLLMSKVNPQSIQPQSNIIPTPQNDDLYNINNLTNQFGMMNLAENKSPIHSQNIKIPQGNIPPNFMEQKAFKDQMNTMNLNQNLSAFAQMKNPNFSIDEIVSNCYMLVKEQFGCRLLQRIIDENPHETSIIFYNKIKENIVELSCQLFGNYFIQKIIENVSMKEIEEIQGKLLPNFFSLLCTNQHGTRVIQALIKRIKDNEILLKNFSMCLKPFISTFIYNQNANHIISNFVAFTSPAYNQMIFDFIQANIIEVSTQKHACCSLQRCIQSGSPQQSQVLLQTIAVNSSKLFANQFGNYVIQFVLTLHNQNINIIIVTELLKNFEEYAKMKYTSCIIERCMQLSDQEIKRMILEKICSDFNLVKNLLYDIYGNYVIQRALIVAQEPYMRTLIEYIGPLLPGLKMVSFGNKLFTKLLKNYPELLMYAPKEENETQGFKKTDNFMMQSNFNMTPMNFQNPNIYHNSYNNFNSNLLNLNGVNPLLSQQVNPLLSNQQNYLNNNLGQIQGMMFSQQSNNINNIDRLAPYLGKNIPSMPNISQMPNIPNMTLNNENNEETLRQMLYNKNKSYNAKNQF
ncbi:MAG: hypothetical protein MJ252_13475 [archaeon]|nr:hypothetical protein [archaeon]